MRHRIKLIDPEKIINPQVIPIVEKYYSQFREHTKPPPIPEADPQENIYEVEVIRDHKIF